MVARWVATRSHCHPFSDADMAAHMGLGVEARLEVISGLFALVPVVQEIAAVAPLAEAAEFAPATAAASQVLSAAPPAAAAAASASCQQRQ